MQQKKTHTSAVPELQTINPQESKTTHSLEGSLDTRILQGISVHHGLTQGYAFLHHPQEEVARIYSKNHGRELNRLNKALADLHGDLASLKEQLASKDQEVQDIMGAFLMIAQDRGWIQKMRMAIQEGFSAEAATQKFLELYKHQCTQKGGEILKERLWDVEDLTGRLLKHLRGSKGDQQAIDDQKPLILIAKSLGPAEFLDYRERNIKALVLEEGMQSAHVSIIAKALDIPMVICVPDLMKRLHGGEWMLVDGRMAKLVLSPSSIVQNQFQEELKKAERKKEMAQRAQSQGAITKDGIPIDIKINAGLVSDLDHLSTLGVAGVGLYRTEIPFMMGQDFLKMDEQVRIYQAMIEGAFPYPITFRTLDVGGDKILPYLTQKEEANPMMGWRAIRIGLDRPMLLRTQLRALLKAAAGQTLQVMFPMLTDLEEFLRAKELLHMEMNYAKVHNILPPFDVKIGAMIEVPSLVWSLPDMIPHVDFLSLGTNDLCQFFFAADRGNPYISKRYDTLSPSFLSYLGHIQQMVQASGKPLTVCGEMASNPLELLALVCLGFRSFSMGRSAVGGAKLMLQTTAVLQIAPYVADLKRTFGKSIRNDLKYFAIDHGILI